MSALLGNYLSYGDLIVVHMCGKTKELNLMKTQEYLGLTITDNGNGRAFVKKVKPNESHIERVIKPGDHISAINSKSTFGMRHYEVAKAIREVPERATFTLGLTEPLYVTETELIKCNLHSPVTHPSFMHDFSRNSLNMNSNDSSNHNVFSSTTNSACTIDLELDSFEDLANSSLPIDRLLSKGFHSATHQISINNNSNDSYRIRIDKINSILESFLGINDNLLAIQIYRLAKENRESFSMFEEAIKESELNVFNFDKDIKSYLWNSAIEQSVR